MADENEPAPDDAQRESDTREPKDQRIPIMMSVSELQAIDDWMFTNRVRSRAEAIRRLCQAGISINPKRSFEIAQSLVSAQEKLLEGQRILIDRTKLKAFDGHTLAALDAVGEATEIVGNVIEESTGSIIAGHETRKINDIAEAVRRHKEISEQIVLQIRSKKPARQND